ncbi:MAG: baseplate J/gp47 family protein [Alphaproteobacteria bacterium]|nr:baseplate J/gp47 family protein [Alphaproteobacteria bacterium]
MPVRIDLSTLPVPDAIEEISVSTLVEEYKTYLLALDDFPLSAERLAHPGEPLVALLESLAYRETLMRSRVNAAVRAVMLPSATGADLDNLGSYWNLDRKEDETDADFRSRIQLSPESYSNAGTASAYRYHADQWTTTLNFGAARFTNTLTHDLDLPISVKDVQVASQHGYTIDVQVLGDWNPVSSINDTANASLQGGVADYLNGPNIRAVCDVLNVTAVQQQYYKVNASITVGPGPDPSVIEDEVQANLAAFRTDRYLINESIPLSGLYAAVHPSGVRSSDLSVSIAINDSDEAPFFALTTGDLPPSDGLAWYLYTWTISVLQEAE